MTTNPASTTTLPPPPPTITSTPSPTITAPPLAAQNRLSRVSFSQRSDSGSRDRYPQDGRRSSSTNTTTTTGRDASVSVTRATSRTRLISRMRRGSHVASTSPGSMGGVDSNEKKKNKGKKDDDGWTSRWIVERDVRTRFPRPLQRFTGYRDPSKSPPYTPLPFPPFSWLSLIPLQYEVWILSTLGGIIGILLIEITMSTTIFLDAGTPLIIASFGAGAVLCYGTIESPLAQPRHVLGGQVISALVGVGVTKLFRLSGGYVLDDTTRTGELGRPVWVSGAIAFGMAFLAMQITSTVHPPGGATALIASVQPSVVLLGWKYVYIIAISSLIMIAWALIINNVGRRRYPHYWIHGTRTFVLDPKDAKNKKKSTTFESEDQVEMEAEEGRRGWDSSVFGLDDLTEEPRGEEDEEREGGGEGVDEGEDERGRRRRVGQRY